MSYTLILAAALSFASGYGLSHKIDRAEIIDLELAIQKQKDEAQSILSDAQFRIKESEYKAAQANDQLDQEHETNIKDIMALRDKLGNMRLRDPGSRSSCPSSVPASANTVHPSGEAYSGELSTELSGFLFNQSFVADKVAEYANECYQFVVEQNCGIINQFISTGN